MREAHEGGRMKAAHGGAAGGAALAQRLPAVERESGQSAVPGVVLVGPPNVGKSALFGALTKSYVTVSNYPGTTVEITTGRAVVDGRRVPVVDTPGAYTLLPTSEDERVTRDLLLERATDAVVVVADAKSLDRTLPLVLQLGEMGLRFVVCLNMMDEARERGIEIDAATLSREAGVEVVPTVAVRRKGLGRLLTAIEGCRAGRARPRYPAAVEAALDRVEPLLPPGPILPRALGVMALAGDETLVAWLRDRVSEHDLARIDDERQKLRREFHEPLAYVIHHARLREARRIASALDGAGPRRTGSRRRIAAWLERTTIHPLWGLPVLAGVLFLAYEFVGVLGAGTLVDLMENKVFGNWINPGATALVDRLVGWAFLRDLLVGEYGVITMALTYALALILPIVTTFFIAFGALEDSGYLPRLAVVVNRGFRRIGLNGKAVLPMVLGLGCDTMATLTARILETRKERLIVTLLLALGVPCSAQLSVILVMLGALSPLAMLLWLGVVFGVLVLVGALAARAIPGKSSDFVLELPPLRVPRPGNILVKTLARLEWYLKEAVPLFVLGTLVLFVVDRLGWLGWMERGSAPVLVHLLGLPRETAGVFIIGFLRRDFGAAGLYGMAEQGLLDPIQVLVAAVTITLFMPCIANFFMIVKERGWRTGLAIASFIVPFAIGVGTVLNALLRLTGIELG